MKTSTSTSVNPTPWIKDNTAPFTGLTRIVYIMDRSGSMSGREKEVIDGFNGWKKEVLNTTGDTDFTLILFDDSIETPIKNTPLDKVHDLDRTKYYVRGTTALLDAIAYGINLTRPLVKGDDRILFLIITDGFENASKEFRMPDGAKKINALIKELEGKGNWTFTYLSSDINGLAHAQAYGFKAGNTMVVGEMGPEAYSAVAGATVSYRSAAQSTSDSFYERGTRQQAEKADTIHDKINKRSTSWTAGTGG